MIKNDFILTRAFPPQIAALCPAVSLASSWDEWANGRQGLLKLFLPRLNENLRSDRQVSGLKSSEDLNESKVPELFFWAFQ